MENAPLPPHERTWRHPSELAASTAQVDPGGPPPRGFFFAGGALAVILVAAMVVALTPRAETTTTAVSATTVPAASARGDGAADTAIMAAKSIRSSRLAAITSIPHGIADVPADALRTAPSATSGGSAGAVLPDLDDRVTVLTDQFVYVVAWRDVTKIDGIDDAIVVDDGGTMIARIEEGRLIVSPDLLVGASISVD